MIFHFSIQVSFVLLLIELHCTFSISYKILPNYVIILCRLGFCFLSLCTFVVPMRECLLKHSRMSSPFLVAILNGIPSFFPERRDRNGRR